MARSKYVSFSFPISAYHPDALQAIAADEGEKALRREYTRLRDIAQKRLMRLEQSEFAGTQIVRYNRDRFKPLREVSSRSELSHLLSDVARFLVSQKSTVSGQREYVRRSVESMREGGLTAVNEKNFMAITESMDWLSSFHEFDPSEFVHMMNAYAEAGVPVNDVLVRVWDVYDNWIRTHKPSTFWEGGWDE